LTRSVAALLDARRNDTNIGLRFDDRVWTWAEVVEESAIRAAIFDALRRDGPFHIGVLLDNVPDYVFALGGAALAGATIVGINPTRRGDELAADIRHTDCQLILTEQYYAPLLDRLDLGLAPDRVLAVEDTRWTRLVREYTGAPPPTVLPPPDTLFVLIFTSGSTGAPKAVRGTQGRYAGFGARMPFAPDDVLYCSMPLFHGNALSSNFIPALHSGATIALRRRFSASEFFDDLRRFGATYFNTVGRALSYILATPPRDDDREHHVKFALGPESSPADIKAFRTRFGIPIITGYGQSEGAIALTPTRGKYPGALGTIGDGSDIAIVDPTTLDECARAEFDEHGRLLNADAAIGEIVRRDPKGVFEGYYNNPAAEAERSRNGWYWSGDLGYRDEDGVFYFAGRTSDWIRVDAENFAAAPIERIIARHPGVGAVVVFGVPDPITGDQVMAVIEPRPRQGDFDIAALRRFLDAQADLGTKWMPRFVRVVDELPVTGAGKIDKKPLRAGGWLITDGVWWQPARGEAYRPFTAEDAEQLRAVAAQHGRTTLLSP